MRTYEVIRVDPTKADKKGHLFRRVVFKPEDYNKNHRVLFCDIVKGFRNTMRWISVLKAYDKSGPGFLVANVTVKDKKHIDADSYPRIVRKA